MTIKKRLFISFSLIILIIVFIIGVFFYTIYNLNSISSKQNHRYDQLIRVERLKEFNNSYEWIVLDIKTDFDKIKIVKDRIAKSKTLYMNLNKLKTNTIDNAETKEEKTNLVSIFTHLDIMYKLINNELYNLIISSKNDFVNFDKKFIILNKSTQILLDEEIVYLQNRLNNTQTQREEFLDTIKLELVILLFISFILSFIISTKIIKEIKDILEKLNMGVLQLFKNDEKTIKVDIGENNELSQITNNLNSYLEKQADIIHSREEMLRNISHELKTPIAKGKFLLQKIHNKEEETIKKIDLIFHDIEQLTIKLLQREKLNFAVLNYKKFKSSSLILESLSKLLIEDESQVEVYISDDFVINGDFYYLVIALKNLIDNALKYTIKFPIVVESKNNIIYVKNIANKFSNDFIYYIQPFTKEPNQQQGHGLGLNIVNKIVELHSFKLEYKHEDSYNILSINCQDKLPN